MKKTLIVSFIFLAAPSFAQDHSHHDMEGNHWMLGDWMLMPHGYIQGVYNDQGGMRGDEKIYTNSMLMLMAQRPWNEGDLELRSMFSLDPIHGRAGYPLLFQTGETANGVNPLIDRQHPHDFFMELSGRYSRNIGENGSGFIYLGLPGEPALGPGTFMHRPSGEEIPEAPISHHWLDSTHITFGVATLGYIWNQFKFEGSAFTGREPNRHRWDIEKPKFDSQSARVTYNPQPEWSMQISYGWLKSPEQLESHDDVRRLTASISRNTGVKIGYLKTTVAYGKNDAREGDDTNAWLLESSLNVKEKHTFMTRGERVEKNELFIGTRAHEIFKVDKLSVGYLYDFVETRFLGWGIGAIASLYRYPNTLDAFYGNNPSSFILFVRTKIL